MDKNEVLLVAQLIKALQRISDQLEIAEKTHDVERFERLKREALELQKRIDVTL